MNLIADTIVLNECINDNACIHLYHSVTADIWQAFGISAFLLERLASEHGIDCIADYSYRMMMPFVVLSSSGFQNLASICDWDKDDSDHLILHSDMQIDRERYRQWVKGLRKM